MDNDKKHNHGEVNYSPVPGGVAAVVGRSGLNICCYYENVRSESKPQNTLRRFPYYCISHLLEGDGFFLNGETGEYREITPGDAIIVCPGTPHQYGALNRYYTEDSICFSGPAADALHCAGIIEDGIVRIGHERRLFSVIAKLRNISLPSQFEANVMLMQLLIELHRVSREASPGEGVMVRLKSLLRELVRDPGRWWTVEEMAGYCRVSENHLRNMFRLHTGMSPKEYIDEQKMTRAVELLCGTGMSVAEIAASLGYADPYHFIRRFTALRACSPGRFRRIMAPGMQEV